MSNEFIFVYGTLRKETATSMYHVLARYCEYFSDGLMQGKLYEVDGYPGAIESDNPNDVVQGEIYRIIYREKVLSKLDEYEECTDSFPQPHEYVRRKLLISLSGGGSISAWVYVFNRDVTGLFQIKNGDYLGYLNSTKENGPNKPN
jgi:gamma-glutamylcyclotransferase (GGCT)/AIG2-like uncharacterized protein YtfP